MNRKMRVSGATLLLIAALSPARAAVAQKGGEGYRVPVTVKISPPNPTTKDNITVTFKAPISRPKRARWLANVNVRDCTADASEVSQFAERTVLSPKTKGRTVTIVLRPRDSSSAPKAVEWCPGNAGVIIGYQTPQTKKENGGTPFFPKQPNSGKAGPLTYPIVITDAP